MTHPELPALPRRNRVRLGLGAALALLVVGLAIAVLITAFGSHGSTVAVAAPTRSATAPSDAEPSGEQSGGPAIFVHILGAVAHPGLFQLKDGDRVVDAVAAAGGYTTAADQTQLNLARVLSDGEQLYVPVVGEAPPVSVAAAGASGATGGKVNLNTADLTALETLPRVGPALAQRILDWRTANGRFTAIEDLMSVSGIGDKTFDGLKDLITL